MEGKDFFDVIYTESIFIEKSGFILDVFKSNKINIYVYIIYFHGIFCCALLRED